uniref:Uncharacterized protein n=1 Tax=Chromera velia CCMP2878 TaxID=1169474 RepID=A0A0G4F3P0_9ALVE|eukprot:Cvel_14860.t1-p1 / transcript=Cvel_14860.t1 / gene=Cvel_14860 / organism=Chromera_velia_CCMP2878 / gene_product=hypothetical protein / transcript_product=hypothetical protein / location=Cvel_scaffold1074:9888-10184(-) / protein_length=99 / sequence_SO=supercontig / SO=protein_coding / is_pseudo=false
MRNQKLRRSRGAAASSRSSQQPRSAQQPGLSFETTPFTSPSTPVLGSSTASADASVFLWCPSAWRRTPCPILRAWCVRCSSGVSQRSLQAGLSWWCSFS